MQIFTLAFLPFSAAFECWSCGVFLSAPSPHCKGALVNVTCPSAKYGCLSVVAEMQDGNYYVEKNCVQPEETTNDLYAFEGCREMGIKGRVGLACICKEHLCNGITKTYLSFLTIALFWFILIIS